MFFDIQRICQNAPKMLPKFSESLPKWAQHGHLGANIATCCQLGSNLAHVATNFAPMSPKKTFQNHATAPKDATRRAKTPPRRLQTLISFDFRPIQTSIFTDFSWNVHRWFILFNELILGFPSNFVVHQHINQNQNNASTHQSHHHTHRGFNVDKSFEDSLPTNSHCRKPKHLTKDTP